MEVHFTNSNQLKMFQTIDLEGFAWFFAYWGSDL